MATLEQNIAQAISDFNDIEAAIQEKGVDVPSGTDTSRYGDMIRSIPQQLIDGVVDQTYSPDSVNAQSGIAVAQAVSRHDVNPFSHSDIREELAEVKESVTQSEKTSKNVYGNAVKSTASGEVIRVDDVSPIEHTVKVKVSGKNLLPCLTEGTSVSENGGAFTVQADGGIVASGIPSAYMYLTVYNSVPLAMKGLVTLSLGGTHENIAADFALYDTAKNVLVSLSVYPSKATATVDLDKYPAAVKWNVSLKRAANDVEMSGVVYPQIEQGDAATEYEPYIDPTTVTVTRCGKNLFDISKIQSDKYINNNGDGTLTVTTITTSSAAQITGVTLADLAPELKVGEIYTLSANSTGTDKYIYLSVAKSIWTFGKSATITQEMLNSYVNLYASGVSTTAVISNIQIEKGNITTDYEPYTAETYTPTTDGTCEIVSVSPTMTLLTDKEGVNIDVEYNQDANVALKNVNTDIRELDRVVNEVIEDMGDIETALDNIITLQNSYIGGEG